MGTVFLVQNDFYSHVLLRAQVQESARAVSELVATEVRSVTAGGVLLADSLRTVVLSPVVNAVVCGAELGDVVVHLPGGSAAVDPDEVAGFGYRNVNTGVWTYFALTWSEMEATGGDPPARCAAQGADTVGASAEFVRLRNIDEQMGFTPPVGVVLALVRATELRFTSSLLEPGTTALYRGLFGETLVEFATGMASTAHFEYRTGGTTYAKSVPFGSRESIDAIRVVARALGKGDTSSQREYEFGWAVDIPLANTN